MLLLCTCWRGAQKSREKKRKISPVCVAHRVGEGREMSTCLRFQLLFLILLNRKREHGPQQQASTVGFVKEVASLPLHCELYNTPLQNTTALK